MDDYNYRHPVTLAMQKEHPINALTGFGIIKTLA